LEQRTEGEEGMNGTKICSTCKVEKNVSEFNKSKRDKSGFSSQCKKCIRGAYYRNHPEVKRRKINCCAPGFKVCTKCGCEKEIHDFHNDKNRKDGKSPWCKECVIKASREWLLKNPSHPREYYERNQDHLKEYSKTYNEDNKASVAECKRNYSILNWDRIQERMKIYRLENDESIKAQRHLYNTEHSEENTIRQRNYYNTPQGRSIMICINQRRRSRNRKSKCTLTLKQWDRILKMQNNRCAECGREFDEKLKPTRDHIIPLSLGGDFTFGNVQALCKICNSRKYNKVDFLIAIDRLLMGD